MRDDPTPSLGKSSGTHPIPQHATCGKPAEISESAEFIVGDPDFDPVRMNLVGLLTEFEHGICQPFLRGLGNQ